MAWWTGQPVYGSNPVSKFIRENFAFLKTYVDYIINSGVTTADLAAVHASPPTLAAVVNITVNTTIGNTDVGLGGGYNISGGVVLTVNGTFSAPLTQIFFGAGTVVFGAGSVKEVYPEWWYSGAGTWTNAFLAAIASFGTNTGKVKCQSRGYDVSGLTITSRVLIEGAGPNVEDQIFVSVYGTNLEITGASGIVMNVASISLRNLNVRGIGANTAVGVWFRGNSNSLENVTILNMGSVGLRIGDPAVAGINANSWFLKNVHAIYNTSHGVVLDDQDAGAGPDANAGSAYGLVCQYNGGDGIVIDNADVNNIYGLMAETNTGYGIHIKANARNNTLWNPHAEGNVAGNCLLDATSTNNAIIGTFNFVPVDNGSNEIIYFGGGAATGMYAALRNLSVGHGSVGALGPAYSGALTDSIGVQGTIPGFTLYELGYIADAMKWALFVNSGAMVLRVLSDNELSYTDAIEIVRGGANAYDTYSVSVPNSNFYIQNWGMGAYSGISPNVTATAKIGKVPVLDSATQTLVGYIQIYEGPGV